MNTQTSFADKVGRAVETTGLPAMRSWNSIADTMVPFDALLDGINALITTREAGKFDTIEGGIIHISNNERKTMEDYQTISDNIISRTEQIERTTDKDEKNRLRYERKKSAATLPPAHYASEEAFIEHLHEQPSIMHELQQGVHALIGTSKNMTLESLRIGITAIREDIESKIPEDLPNASQLKRTTSEALATFMSGTLNTMDIDPKEIRHIPGGNALKRAMSSIDTEKEAVMAK